MTIETYVQDQARSTRGNQVSPVDGSPYANSSQDIADAEGIDEGSERQRRPGTTFARTSPATFALFISGKLARQLSKSLESQLTECISSHQESTARTVLYEKKIVELTEELASLKQLIDQLEEAERQGEGTKPEQIE